MESNEIKENPVDAGSKVESTLDTKSELETLKKEIELIKEAQEVLRLKKIKEDLLAEIKGEKKEDPKEEVITPPVADGATVVENTARKSILKRLGHKEVK